VKTFRGILQAVFIKPIEAIRKLITLPDHDIRVRVTARVRVRVTVTVTVTVRPPEPGNESQQPHNLSPYAL